MNDTQERFISFAQHKETTAKDCEAIARTLNDLAQKVREGDLKAFESFWIEGGSEEGDAKIIALREYFILRYYAREEALQ